MEANTVTERRQSRVAQFGHMRREVEQAISGYIAVKEHVLG